MMSLVCVIYVVYSGCACRVDTMFILCDRPADSPQVTSPVVSALIPFFTSINSNLSPEDRS